MSRRTLLFGPLRRLRENVSVEEVEEREALRAAKTAPEPLADDTPEEIRAAFKAYDEGDYETAANGLVPYCRQFPTRMNAARKLAYALYRCGRFIQARVEFERILRSEKDDNFAKLYLGLALLQTGKTEKALATWRGYQNLEEIPLTREINVQLGLCELPEPPAPTDIIAAVESACGLRRPEELNG
ncbi:MAG: hypothetical protein H0S85_15140 [Desulfovibrionaceae bacterium]|jgi:hypothetical protein|nr:hypothetical protein [Desulfovibrionaceae bacterium]